MLMAELEETKYLYDGEQVILEQYRNNIQNIERETRNVYGMNIISRSRGEIEEELYTISESSKVRVSYSDKIYYQYNGHGDVTQVTNSGGNILASYKYDAFGQIIEKSGTADNPYRYAGYQYDEEQQKYYLNARYYDARIARFISEDTYRGEPDDPLSLNLYAYCSNNPLRYYDPTGHRKFIVDPRIGEERELSITVPELAIDQKSEDGQLSVSDQAAGNWGETNADGIPYFSSREEAAKHFAYNNYGITDFTGLEVGSIIYPVMMPDGSIAYSYLKPAIGDTSSVSLESMYEQDVPIMSKYLAGVTDIDFNELEKALQELPPEQRERIEDYRQEAIDQLRNGTNGAPTRMALIHTHPDTYSGRPLQTEKDADPNKYQFSESFFSDADTQSGLRFSADIFVVSKDKETGKSGIFYRDLFEKEGKVSYQFGIRSSVTGFSGKIIEEDFEYRNLSLIEQHAFRYFFYNDVVGNYKTGIAPGIMDFEDIIDQTNGTYFEGYSDEQIELFEEIVSGKVRFSKEGKR